MKRNNSFEIVGMEDLKAEFIEIIQFLFESCGCNAGTGRLLIGGLNDMEESRKQIKSSI